MLIYTRKATDLYILDAGISKSLTLLLDKCFMQHILKLLLKN